MNFSFQFKKSNTFPMRAGVEVSRTNHTERFLIGRLFTVDTPMIIRKVLALVAVFALPMSMLFASQAVAKTIAYDFLGEWLDQPDQVVSGMNVLGAQWRLDINDDQAAPSNDPVPNNVVTVELENAEFTEIPSVCLTDTPDHVGNEVEPLSTLSSDRTMLTCNLGTFNEGTAQLTVTGMLVNGPAGSQVTAVGSFAGHRVQLPKIPIVNTFSMEAKFDGGTPLSYPGGADQYITFPFSVSHRANTPGASDPLSFDLDIKYTSNHSSPPEVEIRDEGCVPNTRVQSGYPFSGSGHPEEQTAPLPPCSLTKTGPTSFKLTLNGLDYTNAGPRLDSNGQPLPPGMDVIASGDLLLKVAYQAGGGKVNLKVANQDFVATDGQTHSDNPDNNSNAIPVVRGGWTGGWVVGAQRPEAYPGSPWTDTSRAPAGATIMSVGSVKVPYNQYVEFDNWICKVIDTDHVDLTAARVATDVDAQPNIYYDNSYAEDIWYYVGDLKNPGSDEVVDPNFFECGGIVDPHDPATGNQPGWVRTPPADLSTVKAVKARATQEMIGTVTAPNSSIYLVLEQRIKPDTPIGTDIWTWTSALEEGRKDWAMTDLDQSHFHRSFNTAHVPAYGTETPDLRYPYAAPGRDVLRTVGSEPVVEKTVAQNEYGPGQEAEYTVKYGLTTVMAQPAADQVAIIDTLPPGMSYVTGSAISEPKISGEVSTGQILTWMFDDITPNQELETLTFRATIPDDAELGSTQKNVVEAKSQGITREASAEFIIPNSGYTSLVKQVAQHDVATDDEGNADVSWDITLSSRDPNRSDITDIIDLLPYDGDERGTTVTGSLALREVNVPVGATVYYTTVAPSSLDEDPTSPVNGALGQPSSIWSTEFRADATAIRIVGGSLSFGGEQRSTVTMTISGAYGADNVLVGTAVGRVESTELRMRTSDYVKVTAPSPQVEPTPVPEPSPEPDPSPTPEGKPKLPQTGAQIGQNLVQMGALLIAGIGAVLLSHKRRER